MGSATQRQQAMQLRDAFEVVFAISAGITGLAGIAYFLFAPRLAIGTASPECGAISNLSACAPPSYYSLVETTFSPGWGIYFTLLTLLWASIPVMAILHIHTRSPWWRWALIVVAVLVLVGSALLNDSLLIISPIAFLQSGISLLPGVVFGLFTAIVAVLNRRRSTNPNGALAIQG
jgi:hypothetical protein